ncbi:hypothetical protein NPIL_313171 [Nephila pilipes]|uniref:Uncharacterized protein n=1 Tax=Nephila pilipes TaxID=299642 RepID=A0A8X6QNC0_NEPPI|nr:hypothetical protein NPIL_313171 [Nephila pilipes]
MSRVEDALHCTQKVFSLPSFLMFVAHFCTCITVLASIVVFKPDLNSNMQLVWILLLINSFCGLVAILWKAGSLPIEAEKLKKPSGENVIKFYFLRT